MKLYVLVALIAATSAMRMTEVNTPISNTMVEANMQAEAAVQWDESQKAALKKWLWDKAKSGGKLTWNDLSKKITALKTANGGTMTADKLKQYKDSFNAADTRKDGVIGGLELRKFLELRGMV